MNCDANGLAEKFRKLMDDGDVKPLKEGFFTDSMEVGISVDGVKVTSHLLHQIQLKIQGSKHQKYLQDKHGWNNAMEQFRLDRNKVWILVTWPFETNQDFEKYAWMVKYGPPKDKDLAGCNGFAQVSVMP
jgi:hypothetical protein